MTGVIAWLGANKLAARALGIGAVLAVLVAIVVGLQMKGRHDQRVKDEAAAAVGVAKAEHRNSGALEAAAVERQVDAAKAAATEKELVDAGRNLPDARPSARRTALGCERLRRAGRDTSGLPECRGPGGGG